MVDPLVGGFHLPQGFPLVPCLPAGLLPRRLAQTFPPRFLLEPIARWRLPTVRTVQPQPTLKLFHTSQQGINQRVFLVAGQLAKVGPLSHSQLESHFPLFGNPYNHTGCWGVTPCEHGKRRSKNGHRANASQLGDWYPRMLGTCLRILWLTTVWCDILRTKRYQTC